MYLKLYHCKWATSSILEEYKSSLPSFAFEIFSIYMYPKALTTTFESRMPHITLKLADLRNPECFDLCNKLRFLDSNSNRTKMLTLENSLRSLTWLLVIDLYIPGGYIRSALIEISSVAVLHGLIWGYHSWLYDLPLIWMSVLDRNPNYVMLGIYWYQSIMNVHFDHKGVSHYLSMKV